MLVWQAFSSLGCITFFNQVMCIQGVIFFFFFGSRDQQNYHVGYLSFLGLDLSGTELSYRLNFLFEEMGMEDWGVVEGVSYLYVIKGHLISGQVKQKEGGKAVWDCLGRVKDPKLWASHTWPQMD